MRKKHKLRLLVPIFLLSFISCEKVDYQQPNSSKRGGIVITFDDKSISKWYLADSLLHKYHWKATFCVSFINTLTTNEIDKLHALQDAGHEIAGHGLNHIDAVNYVSNNSITSYLNQEIIPMIEIMKKESFRINSFAYPYGRRNKELDTALKNYFKILRGTTYGEKNSSKHICYFNNSSIVFGFGIDSSNKISEKYILDLLHYAKINDKILIVYGHTPVVNITGDYQISISTLDLICKYIEENNMNYYTLSDLMIKN